MREVRDGSAIISPCGQFRYFLKRQWGIANPPRVITWVMLNPSTADANQDDPTIRKCIGFSRLWGFEGLAVVNLYAYRATDPKELRKAFYPVGPENDTYLRLASAGGKVVVAWGCHAQKPRAKEVMEILKKSGDVYCLGRTQMGFPKHPLFVKYDTPLEIIR